MSKSNTRLVYSDDGSHLKICKKCKEDPCLCKKVVQVDPSQTKLKLRLEKSGRGGKMVTVVFDLPNNPDFFKPVLKKLKAHCGCGGSMKDGTIEIQGDQRPKVKQFLEKMGFQVVLAGG